MYIEIVLFLFQCNPYYSSLFYSRSYLYLTRNIMFTYISINCIYTYIWIAQPSIFLYQQMHCIVSSHYHPLLIIFKHCDFSINLNPLSLCILHQCESTSVNPPLVRICPSMRICPSWESPINLNSLSLCILHQYKSSIEGNLSFDENHPLTKTLHYWIILVKILIH